MPCHAVQLPAGVIEQGETVEQLAVRELKEETGYVGQVTRVTTEAANDQGLTNSCLNVSSGVHWPATQSLCGKHSLRPLARPAQHSWQPAAWFVDDVHPWSCLNMHAPR